LGEAWNKENNVEEKVRRSTLKSPRMTLSQFKTEKCSIRLQREGRNSLS